jgi:hypothetical protein
MHCLFPVQFAQRPASTPQAFFIVPAKHVIDPEQQPAQLTLSQMHDPATQCCPLVQAFPVPQPQVPLARQVSVRTASHTVQVPPALPQVSFACGSQTPKRQQPVAQLLAEQVAAPHMPPSHVPLPHCTQALPLVPQLIAVVPVWHTPFWQHPPGQLVESQVGVAAQPPS